MKNILILILSTVFFCSCTSKSASWADLNESANEGIEKGIQQTQLALIGEIQTPDGSFLVAHQRLVITGMLSPRGLNNLLLFQKDGALVKRFTYVQGLPLWCEGSKIYWWGTEGHANNIETDTKFAEIWPDSAENGNVLDFSKGINKGYFTREKRYGSSGGIEDDPWEK